MLKNKFRIITLLVVLILAITIPVVRAENEVSDSNETMLINNTDVDVEQDDSHSDHQEEYTDENFKKSDIYITGNDVTIDYIVDGNLFVIANNVTINSQIGGDAFICANSVTVEEQGYIFSNLFVASKTLDIKGVVCDLYATTDNATISGYVYRDIRASANSLNIFGTIGRNAFVSCSDMKFMQNENSQDNNEENISTVTSQGKINGNLEYSSVSEISIPENSVSGETKYTEKKIEAKNIQDYLLSLGTFVSSVVIIWLLCLWLAPKLLENSNKLLVSKTLPVIGLGILTPIAMTVAFVILLLLGITSGIAFLLLASLFILIGISSSMFITAINNIICNKLKIQKTIGIFGMLILSSIVLWLIALIPVVGTLVTFAAVIIGLGIITSNILLKDKEPQSKEQ